MECRVVGLDKSEEGFILIGEDFDFPIAKANSFVDPIWLSMSQEAEQIASYSAKKTFLFFDIKCVENHPKRGTLVHFKGIYDDGLYTEGVVSIEQNEEKFTTLLKDLEKCLT